MTNVVKLKRGSGSDPSASDMVVGEPVIRTDTAELFFKKDDILEKYIEPLTENSSLVFCVF